TVVIDGKPQPPRVKGKQGVRKEEKSIPTNVSEKVAEYNAEKQVELSEVEKLKQELAKVKQENADLKSKKDRGLFESSDLKQSEEKIAQDRKSTRLNSSHVSISYAVFCLKKKKKKK